MKLPASPLPEPVDPRASRGRILFFMGLLHMMCHGLLSLITPLYDCMQVDFQLSRVEPITSLTTWGWVTFAAATLLAGHLCDRLPGKLIAAVGLAVQGLGLIGLAFAPSLGWARFWVVLSFAGAAGYHPVAGRVVIGLFPEAVGKAIGLAGIGAGLGFLFGPWFSGFRTELAGWHAPLWDATAWRAPMLEAGCFALAVALVYSVTTREPHLARHQVDVDRGRATPRQKRDLILLICLLGVALIPREFANAGLEALGSLFFQRGYGLAVGTVGLVLAFKGLISLLTNPLVALLSDRGHRLWWLSAMWLGCGVCGALVPWLPPVPAQIALVLSGTFMLANYPVFESALLERLPAHVRGRAYSLILAIVGAAAAFAPKLMGRAVDGLTSSAARTVPPELFRPLFGLLAVAVGASLVAIPLLVALKGHNERFGR